MKFPANSQEGLQKTPLFAFAMLDRARAETVLITASNQGIGLDFAKQYADRGWTVIATHRRDSTPGELARLMQRHPKVRVERMNVSDHGRIEALAAKLKGQPMDILFTTPD